MALVDVSLGDSTAPITAHIKNAWVTEMGASMPRFANANHHWSQRKGLILTLESADGTLGRGECSPLPGYSTLSFETAKVNLQQFAKSIPLSARQIPRLHRECRLAVETAVLDIEAQRMGTSIAALIAVQRAQPVAASMLAGVPQHVHALDPHIRCIKFKVGPYSDWPDQHRAVQRFVDANPTSTIRLDFNASLSTDQAKRVISDLTAKEWATNAVDYIEDICADLETIATLGSPIALAVDAPLAQSPSIAHALKLIESSKAQVAVIKPALFGGLASCHELAMQLASRGIETIVSHLLDGPIALGAYAELACAMASFSPSSPTPRAAAIGPHPALIAFGVSGFEQLKKGNLSPVIRARSPR